MSKNNEYLIFMTPPQFGYLEVLSDQSSDTFLKITGSIIHSNSWKAQKRIIHIKVNPIYIHHKVNHSHRNFVDINTQAHTNHVCEKMQRVRSNTCMQYINLLPFHLDKFSWCIQYDTVQVVPLIIFWNILLDFTLHPKLHKIFVKQLLVFNIFSIILFLLYKLLLV